MQPPCVHEKRIMVAQTLAVNRQSVFLQDLPQVFFATRINLHTFGKLLQIPRNTH